MALQCSHGLGRIEQGGSREGWEVQPVKPAPSRDDALGARDGMPTRTVDISGPTSFYFPQSCVCRLHNNLASARSKISKATAACLVRVQPSAA